MLLHRSEYSAIFVGVVSTEGTPTIGCTYAGRLQKMSNFNVLARPSASLAPARRLHTELAECAHPPRLRYFLRARFLLGFAEQG